MGNKQKYVKVTCEIVVEDGSTEINELLKEFEYVGAGHGLYTIRLGIDKLSQSELHEFKSNYEGGKNV